MILLAQLKIELKNGEVFGRFNYLMTYYKGLSIYPLLLFVVMTNKE
jgi:hypothetical protein